jgi:hypothetical protein
MLMRKKLLLAVFTLLLLASGFASSTVNAKGNEYDAVCNHLKTKYKAKKVKIPFMWLARAAVGIIRPAGVKSFKVTIFKNLQFSRDTLHKEMQSAMKESFSDEWSPILRIRSRNGEQVYMNIRQSGKNVKVLVVTIDGDQAVVVRAKFNPNKLVKFIENPKIFGISLTGGGKKKSGIKGKRVKGDKIIYEEDDDTNE